MKRLTIDWVTEPVEVVDTEFRHDTSYNYRDVEFVAVLASLEICSQNKTCTRLVRFADGLILQSLVQQGTESCSYHPFFTLSSKCLFSNSTWMELTK
jgi:hypothetical protein